VPRNHRPIAVGVVVALLSGFAAMTPAAHAATADTPPGAPTGLTATAANTTVTLSWTAPAANGGSSIIGYNVYEGTSPGGESAAPINGAIPIAATSANITDLKDGTTYYFVVRALNSAGISEASNEVSATPSNAPGAPTDLTATPANTTIALAWTAPASDGGSSINGYNVYEGSTPGGESSTPVNSSLVTTTSLTVTDLFNGVAYYFTVKAVNSEGSSAASDEASAIPVVTSPGPPAGLTASAGNSRALLSWSPPASDGGEPILGYNIYQGTLPGGESPNPINGTLITTTSAIAGELTNGTAYYFTVRAVNGVGASAASNEATAKPTNPPGAPTGLAATPSNLSVKLSWSAPAPNGSSAVTGYDVFEGTTSGGESTAPANASPITSPSYTVTGLTNGVLYYFTVEALNAGGLSVASTEASATPEISAPDAPGEVIATPGRSSVDLAWAAPPDGGSPITGYNVYEGTTSGGEADTPANGKVLITTTSASVTGLVNGTTYYFIVEAVNGLGPSAASEEVSAIPANPPDAPTGLRAAPGSTSVSLTWNPASDGGSPITAYYVFGGTTPSVKTGSVKDNVLKTRIAATELHGRTVYKYLVSGLTDGMTYEFTVKAVNAVGTSPASNEASATPKATSMALFTLSRTKTTYGHEQAVRISVRVSSAYTGSTPTGTVRISESTKTLCRIALSHGAGSCRLSKKQLAVGTYNLVASYGGNSIFFGSTAAKEILKIAR